MFFYISVSLLLNAEKVGNKSFDNTAQKLIQATPYLSKNSKINVGSYVCSFNITIVNTY